MNAKKSFISYKDPGLIINEIIRYSYDADPMLSFSERLKRTSEAYKIIASSVTPHRRHESDPRVIYCEKHGLAYERRGRCLKCINLEYAEKSKQKSA